MSSESFFVLDFETTGLSPVKGARVIEVAAVGFRAGREFQSFESLVNPGVHVPREITKLTGITQDMVDSAPRSKDVFDELRGVLDGCLVVAHNARFDMSFLVSEMQRLNFCVQGPAYCSLMLARKLCPELCRVQGAYRLDNLRKTFGVSGDFSAHRAGADVRATAAVVMHLATLAMRQSSARKLGFEDIFGSCLVAPGGLAGQSRLRFLSIDPRPVGVRGGVTAPVYANVSEAANRDSHTSVGTGDKLGIVHVTERETARNERERMFNEKKSRLAERTRSDVVERRRRLLERIGAKGAGSTLVDRVPKFADDASSVLRTVCSVCHSSEFRYVNALAYCGNCNGYLGVRGFLKFVKLIP